jgi:formylglycine-generating enzyme required for sulfatase activity
MKRFFFLCSILALSFAAHRCTSAPLSVTDEIYKNMVLVKGGTFSMGNSDRDAYSWEKPVHSVTVSSFYISKYVVTKKQWSAIMDTIPSIATGDDLPVVNVSWEDTQRFIQKLNELTGKQYRLPTEAEWEFAARGGNNSRKFKYAGSYNVHDVAWCKSNSKGIQPAGTTKSANELGLYDMSGNVWEWCHDWYAPYANDAQVDPKGPDTGSTRVYRGGSWFHDARSCNVSYRSSGNPQHKSNIMGFRLCL